MMLVRLLAAALAVGTPASAATLDLLVSGVQPGTPVVAALCRPSLAQRDCWVVWRDDRPSGQAAEHRLDVPVGRYAVVVFQDTNGNGRLDTWLGLPTERYGLSNEVGRFAPPAFDRAAVAVPAAGARVVVRLARLGQPG